MDFIAVTYCDMTRIISLFAAVTLTSRHDLFYSTLNFDLTNRSLFPATAPYYGSCAEARDDLGPCSRPQILDHITMDDKAAPSPNKG